MQDAWVKSYLPVTADAYSELVFELSLKIKPRAHDIDLLVTIARGGFTIAELLSDHLRLPIASFTIQSYKDIKKQGELEITFGLGATLESKKVLLVDDIADSGKTFVRGIAYLEELGAQKKDITTAALFYKPHSVFKPDFFVVETSAWIIKPSEIYETFRYLYKQWTKEGLNKKEMQRRFTLLKFPKNQVEYYLATLKS